MVNTIGFVPGAGVGYRLKYRPGTHSVSIEHTGAYKSFGAVYFDLPNPLPEDLQERINSADSYFLALRNWSESRNCDLLQSEIGMVIKRITKVLNHTNKIVGSVGDMDIEKTGDFTYKVGEFVFSTDDIERLRNAILNIHSSIDILIFKVHYYSPLTDTTYIIRVGTAKEAHFYSMPGKVDIADIYSAKQRRNNCALKIFSMPKHVYTQILSLDFKVLENA